MKLIDLLGLSKIFLKNGDLDMLHRLHPKVSFLSWCILWYA